MMQFERSKFRDVPERLFHYTKSDAAWNIVTGGPVGQLCFLLKDAKCKNDKSELMLGVSLLEGIRSYLTNKGQSSILDQLQCFDNVYLKEVSAVAGKDEAEGNFGDLYDKTYDDLYFGENTWEQAEIKGIYDSVEILLNKLPFDIAELGVEYIFDKEYIKKYYF